MGTIIIVSNVDGLYYNLSRRIDDTTVYIKTHAPLPLEGATIPVDAPGLYQATIIDLDGLYGGGQFGESVMISADETVTVEKNFFDTDGNPLKPLKPIPGHDQPNGGPVDVPPGDPDPALTQPNDGGVIIRLIRKVLHALARLLLRL